MQAAATQGPFPGTAHVHLIGEITGAVGLGLGPLYCTWQLVYDARLWSIAPGQDKVCLCAWQATNLSAATMCCRALTTSHARCVYSSSSSSSSRYKSTQQ
jgi:hypothetical protein